jgi:hypothetical protein
MVLGISSKKMRTAVEKADTVVQVRDDHHKYPDGGGEGGGAACLAPAHADSSPATVPLPLLQRPIGKPTALASSQSP